MGEGGRKSGDRGPVDRVSCGKPCSENRKLPFGISDQDGGHLAVERLQGRSRGEADLMGPVQ